MDQTEIPFRVGDAFFEPRAAGKILIAGAVEVIDRGAADRRFRMRALSRGCAGVFVTS